jgi:hypothetical protein
MPTALSKADFTPRLGVGGTGVNPPHRRGSNYFCDRTSDAVARNGKPSPPGWEGDIDTSRPPDLLVAAVHAAICARFSCPLNGANVA